MAHSAQQERPRICVAHIIQLSFAYLWHCLIIDLSLQFLEAELCRFSLVTIGIEPIWIMAVSIECYPGQDESGLANVSLGRNTFLEHGISRFDKVSSKLTRYAKQTSLCRHQHALARHNNDDAPGRSDSSSTIIHSVSCPLSHCRNEYDIQKRSHSGSGIQSVVQEIIDACRRTCSLSDGSCARFAPVDHAVCPVGCFLSGRHSCDEGILAV